MSPANRNSAALAYNRGLEKAKAGKLDEAIPHLQDAIREDPFHVRARNVLGKIYVKLGQDKLAEKCWRQVLIIDPDDAVARRCLDALEACRKPIVPSWQTIWLSVFLLLLLVLGSIAYTSIIKRIEILQDEARPISRPGAKAAEAVDIKSNPDERKIPQPGANERSSSQLGSVMKYRVAVYQMLSGEYSQAADSLSELKNDPSLPEDLRDNVHYWLGVAHAARRRFDKALSEYRKVIEDFPTSNKRHEAMLKAASCYADIGKYGEAAALLESLIREKPKNLNLRTLESKLDGYRRMLAK